MDRREDLLAVIPEENRVMIGEVVDEVVFLEERLEELKKLPFIQVNPKNPMQQRNTPAAKMYKEFLQQYINCIKMIEYVLYKDKKLDNEEAEESPLREWFRNHVDNGRKKDLDA